MISLTFDWFWQKEEVDLADKKDILPTERVWDTNNSSIGNVYAQVGIDFSCNSDSLG